MWNRIEMLQHSDERERGEHFKNQLWAPAGSGPFCWASPRHLRMRKQYRQSEWETVREGDLTRVRGACQRRVSNRNVVNSLKIRSGCRQERNLMIDIYFSLPLLKKKCSEVVGPDLDWRLPLSIHESIIFRVKLSIIRVSYSCQRSSHHIKIPDSRMENETKKGMPHHFKETCF